MEFKQAGNEFYKSKYLMLLINFLEGNYTLAVVEYSKAADMNVLHVNMAPIFSNRS